MIFNFGNSGELSGISNLNEDNFFGKLNKHYPSATKFFFKWIENYRLETMWDENFKYPADTKRQSSFGFYRIPFEMQMGIIIYFFRNLAKNEAFPNFLSYLPIDELVDNFQLYVIRGFYRLETVLKETR